MSGHKQSVWPKEIQYAFVQGFQAYYDAPYPTHTLGRSGPDQFIEQVASRMQVLRQKMRKSGNHPVDGGAQLYRSSFLSPINPQSPPKNVEILAIIHVELSKLAPGVISSRLPVAPLALQLCSSQTVCAAIETPSPPSHRNSFIRMEEVEDEGAAPPLPSLPWSPPYLLERESSSPVPSRGHTRRGWLNFAPQNQSQGFFQSSTRIRVMNVCLSAASLTIKLDLVDLTVNKARAPGFNGLGVLCRKPKIPYRRIVPIWKDVVVLFGNE
ncbi:hypothetical protein B0H14DRAFT_2618450 [Mycena olivaceomarginata]|nr:hypothetical protein B0H14DRAFT_2618450 [Mycena olivaceomarginata]